LEHWSIGGLVSGGPKVRMTRRVYFSAGHRYWIPSLSEEENRALFGKWASPYNHGHNYVLDVAVEGEMEPETGMIVNIKRIDDALREHVLAQFADQSINDEVPHFQSRASTLENLLLYIRGELSGDVLPPEARLVGLRLEEKPTLYGELSMTDGNEKITLTRMYEFAASHRLHCYSMSDEENAELFGKCNNPAGHGHNYVLEVTVEGEPDERTGMLCDLEELDRRVNELVVDRYDHRNLNEDLPEFAGKPTTSEAVVAQIYSTLDGNLPAKLHRVRLHETARNIFEISAT
jgi:6-pyruvoyltetrahydropterin/6-carboxytetrahydropterin synthase